MRVERMVGAERSLQRTIKEKTLFHVSSKMYFVVPSFGGLFVFVCDVEKAFRWKKAE